MGLIVVILAFLLGLDSTTTCRFNGSLELQCGMRAEEIELKLLCCLKAAVVSELVVFP